MAGAFSGHLVESFNLANMSRTPFGQSNPIATHGAISFNAQMHGTQNSSAWDTQLPFTDVSEATQIKIATLQAKLNQKLGPEYISQRPGPGGGPKLTYAEGWKIINLANEVFGFNGWSSNVISLTTDFIDFNEESKRFTVGVTAILRVTLRDGVFHEDVGYGMLENSKSKGGALDKCKKEAVTDALKRSLRNFGNLLGNCLYDKSYTQEVIKIKVPPVKFDKSQLHRRPEFEETKPNIATTPNASSSITPQPIKTEQQQQATSNKPILFLPPHVRSDMGKTANTPSKPSGLSRHVTNNGLNTPVKTPVLPSKLPNPGVNVTPVLSKHLNKEVAMQPKPPPPLPTMRTVTFADQQLPHESSSVISDSVGQEHVNDGDDSFNFFSDDDAFLAAVDLGEGDLGRPINFDEGIGVLLSSVPEAEENASSAGDRGDQGSGSAPQQRQASSSEAMQKSSDQPENGRSPFLFTARANHYHKQQQQQQRATVSTSVPPAAVADDTRDRPTENVHPAQSRAVPIDPSSSRRSATPSVGGFHFPPGINPLSSAQPRAGGHQHTTLGQPAISTSVVGVKRPAESMLPPSRRPMQGMGLAQSTGGGGTGWGQPNKREPFAQLELREGGDIKRARN